MIRRLILVLSLSATLAMLVLPSSAQLHHRHSTVRKQAKAPEYQAPLISEQERQQQPWWIPLLLSIPGLFFLFGATPGIIACSKGIPNWKSYFWRGLFFGYLFFPIVLFLLYQVLKYQPDPIEDQSKIRPHNVVLERPNKVKANSPALNYEPDKDQ